MRVLFVAWPGEGHLHPLIPLAEALVSAGHEVAFATTPDFFERAEAFNFPAYSCGVDLQHMFEQSHEQLSGSEVPIAPWRITVHLIARIGCAAMAKDLLPICQQWQPDLLVHDSAALAGPLVATAAGIPWVHHGVGRRWPWFSQALGKEVADVWRQYGLEPLPLGGMYRYLVLEPFPPGLTGEHAIPFYRSHPIRPVLADRASEDALPPWIDKLSGNRPTVYFTLGTTFSDNPDLVSLVVRALSEEPVNLVITLGPRQEKKRMSEALPSNVYVGTYVPNSQLLPYCDVVACHGGSGTVLGALTFGLPLLVFPQGYDNGDNGRSVAKAGAGIMLEPSDWSAESIQDGIRRLLEEPCYRAAAEQIQAEILEMPAPEHVVLELERVAREASIPRSREPLA